MNTPDLTSYRLIHRAIRQSTSQLATAMEGLAETDRFERGRQLTRWYAGLEGELHLHHTIEDDFFFPALFQHVPALRGYLERIDDEHHELAELIVDTRVAILAISDPRTPFADASVGAVRRAGELDALMDRHLDFEDAEILPLFTRHMDAQEYVEIESKALAKPSMGQLRFTVPWLMANASPDEQQHLLDGAPFMMKLLWIATRRSHDRLTSAALGDRVTATAAEVAS